MKHLFTLLLFLLLPSGVLAQKPPINGVAGPTTSAQFGSVITNPFGSPSTGDRALFAAPANNGVLVTNGSGLPSISTTLPGGLTMPAPTITGTLTHTGAVVSLANGALASTPTAPDNQFAFTASGTHYFDNNISLQNTTTNGSQCGNAAIFARNAQDGNQIGALFGNMSSTVCGNSAGVIEHATWFIGLGDVGGPSAQRFDYSFAINVANGANSTYFPNA